MAIVTEPYSVQVDHDGRKYQVTVPALTVPKCSNCGTIQIDSEAGEQIDKAFRMAAGLLSPEDIRAGREKLRLNQQEFADTLGIATSTLSRWETGAQVQQRVMNDYLRAFFKVPALRRYLMRLRGGAGESTERAALVTNSPE
jgi:putative zinc finger/helix-turn-helix YgiT family protein